MRYAMIMAGGVGTRLWPMSRQTRPKQLIEFIDGRSLLEIAAARIELLVPVERQFICTAESFRDRIRALLPRFDDENILGEPVGRDTVNAIGLTAAVLAHRDPEATFAVLTADHLIKPEDRFRETIDRGFELVEDDHDRLVTFSIEPTYPATQFGYVERRAPINGTPDAFIVERFVEKPKTQAKAQYLIDTGCCAWNSGMFIFSARGFLRALARFKPAIHEGILKIQSAWSTGDRPAVLEAEYAKLEKTSVDYAILEPGSVDPDFEVCTVLMDVDWVDVGSWPSYGNTLEADASGNRGNTPTGHLDSRNILAVSDDPDHVISTIRCHDLIVIHTKDVTLVCPASEAERIKDLAATIDPQWR